MCTAEIAYVCTADGKLYSNACKAKCAGYTGTLFPPVPSADVRIATPQCPAQQGFGDGPTCACPKNIEYTCHHGKLFNNACEAACAANAKPAELAFDMPIPAASAFDPPTCPPKCMNAFKCPLRSTRKPHRKCPSSFLQLPSRGLDFHSSIAYCFVVQFLEQATTRTTTASAIPSGRCSPPDTVSA